MTLSSVPACVCSAGASLDHRAASFQPGVSEPSGRTVGAWGAVGSGAILAKQSCCNGLQCRSILESFELHFSLSAPWLFSEEKNRNPGLEAKVLEKNMF